MKVELTNFKRQSKAGGHGWSIDFKIPAVDSQKPPPKAVIYQNVYVKIATVDENGDADKEQYKFTEAWKYNSKKNITDSFLIPVSWRENQKGYVRVNTVIWSELGKINPKLKQSPKGTTEYWGNLHGSFNLLEPKGQETIRRFKVEWDNIGLSKGVNFSKGKDLNLVRNN